MICLKITKRSFLHFGTHGLFYQQNIIDSEVCNLNFDLVLKSDFITQIIYR